MGLSLGMNDRHPVPKKGAIPLLRPLNPITTLEWSMLPLVWDGLSRVQLDAHHFWK